MTITTKLFKVYDIMKKMPRKGGARLAFTCLCLYSTALNAQEQPQSVHQKIVEQVKQEVTYRLQDHVSPFEQQNRKLQLSVNPIDPRVEIPECTTRRDIDVTNEDINKPHFSVRVGCASNNWFVYTTVQVSYTQQIVVTNGTIAPGTLINQHHLRMIDVDAARLVQTVFHDVSEVIGARMKHRTRDGQPVEPTMLCYICRGDRITIVARVGSMEVKTSGIAQEDGTIGDTISVKNTRSKKMVFGEVSSTDEILVAL